MNEREAFEAACELMPEGVTWGEPITPNIVKHIAEAALASQAQQESKNWKEDYADGENMYQCTCSICEARFYGYKRRVVCKACDAAQAQQPPRMQFLDRSKEKIIILLWQGICDGTVEAFDVNGMMVIPSEEGMTYVRKEDAISFFGLVEKSQTQQESRWNPIETAPKNKKIFVTYKNALGKKRTVFAKYLDKFTEEATAGTDCETDYCEADDTFYCKEGWVELIDNWDEFSSVYFDSRNVPTHWMPLPPAPEGDKP